VKFYHNDDLLNSFADQRHWTESLTVDAIVVALFHLIKRGVASIKIFVVQHLRLFHRCDFHQARALELLTVRRNSITLPCLDVLPGIICTPLDTGSILHCVSDQM
jgi:hypothetical protein